MSNRMLFAAGFAVSLVGCGGAPVEVVPPPVPVGPAPVVAVAAPLPDRTLLRGGEKDKLYIIVRGQRRITDVKTVEALGIPAATAREVSPGEFAAIPEGKPLRTNWQINKLIPQDLSKLRDRTLIRASDSPRLYLVCNGQRHWIDDPSTFTALGLNPNEIITISPDQMAQVPDGPAW